MSSPTTQTSLQHTGGDYNDDDDVDDDNDDNNDDDDNDDDMDGASQPDDSNIPCGLPNASEEQMIVAADVSSQENNDLQIGRAHV